MQCYSSQHCCLQRQNHHTEMLDMFARMFDDELFTDVTLMCDDGSIIKAHKMVLSACSIYFENIFDKLTSSYQYPIVIMKDIPIQDLRAILEFIYKGRVTVPQQRLESVLNNANWLRVKGLTENSSNKLNCNYKQSEQLKFVVNNRPQEKIVVNNRPQGKKQQPTKNPNDRSEKTDNPGRSQYLKRIKNKKHTDNNNHMINNKKISNISPLPKTISTYSLNHYVEHRHDDQCSDLEIEPSRLLEQTMITGNQSECEEEIEISNDDSANEDVKPFAATSERSSERSSERIYQDSFSDTSKNNYSSYMQTSEQPTMTVSTSNYQDISNAMPSQISYENSQNLANDNYLVNDNYLSNDNYLANDNYLPIVSYKKKKHRKRPELPVGVPKGEIIELVQKRSHRISYVAPKRFKCDLWQNFSRILLDGEKTNFISCNICKLVVTHTDTSGTNSLRRHKCHI